MRVEFIYRLNQPADWFVDSATTFSSSIFSFSCFFYWFYSLDIQLFQSVIYLLVKLCVCEATMTTICFLKMENIYILFSTFFISHFILPSYVFLTENYIWRFSKQYKVAVGARNNKNNKEKFWEDFFLL